MPHFPENCIICGGELSTEIEKSFGNQLILISCLNRKCRLGEDSRYSCCYNSDELVLFHIIINIYNKDYRIFVSNKANVSIIGLIEERYLFKNIEEDDSKYFHYDELARFDYKVCKNNLDSAKKFLSHFLNLKAFA